MDDKFKFVYPIIQVEQLAFGDDGKSRRHMVDTFGEGHILYQGRLMCEKVLPKDKRHKITTKTLRIEGSRICLSCQQKYKDNLDSDWNKWISGISKVADKTPEMAKF